MRDTVNRRHFLAVCSTAGVGQGLFPGALMALATGAAGGQEPGVAAGALPKITAAMVDDAAAIAGIAIDEAQKAMLVDGLNSQRESVLEIRKLPLPNSVAPAMVFDPVPGGMVLDTIKRPLKISAPPHTVVERHGDAEKGLESIAFLSVRELAELVRTKKVKSVELTKMYLARLKRLDAKLHLCDHADRRARAAAGDYGRRGDCGGQVPGAAARDSVGREGPAGGQGVSDDVGCGRI